MTPLIGCNHEYEIGKYWLTAGFHGIALYGKTYILGDHHWRWCKHCGKRNLRVAFKTEYRILGKEPNSRWEQLEFI